MADGGGGTDLRSLSCSELNSRLLDLHLQLNLLQAQISRTIRQADLAQAFLLDGLYSMPSWLRAKCLLSANEASNAVLVARRLEELPLVAAAFDEGELGFRQVTQLAHFSKEVGLEMVLPHQEALLALARTRDPRSLGGVLGALRYELDSDSVLKEGEAIFERRSVTLSQSLDGVYYLNGSLDPESGAILQSALQSLMGRGVDDQRRPWQRRADALVEMARRRLEAGDLPVAGGVRPQLSLLASVATLRLEAGAAPARLGWAGLVHGHTARRLACDSVVAEVSVGADGDPLDVGRSRRLVNRRQRRALVARDGGCGFPECDLPPEWTEGHHLDHWIDGGRTTVRRMVLLCRRHHRLVHEGGWRVDFGPDRKLIATPPWAQQTA